MGEPTDEAPLEPEAATDDGPLESTADAPVEASEDDAAAPQPAAVIDFGAPIDDARATTAVQDVGVGAEAILDGGHASAAASRARPTSAPDNARWDLDVYRQRAVHFGRQAQRAGITIILLTALTATVGAFTVVFDEAWLGVVTGVLGAIIGGIESWRMVSKVDRKAAAYRAGFTEIESELDLFGNDGGAYGTILDSMESHVMAESRKRAQLTERLVAINKAALSASD